MAAIVEKTNSTKDRARLAREKREERERFQASREKELWEKEQRFRKQYERSVEERGRRLEEQRQREERRRAAVEQKRRQRGEEEKEHLEALMRRSEDRGPPLEPRPKRWTWGGPPRTCEGDPKIAPPSPAASSILANEPASLPPANQSKAVPDFMIPPECPELDLIACLSSSNSSAALAQTTERASPSPHRSPYKASPSRAERRKASSTSGPLEESRGAATTPKTPQTEKQVGVITESSAKQLESPMTPTKNSSGCKKPSTPKRSKSCKSRIQSPCSPGQYPTSPMKHRAMTPGADNNKRLDGEEKGLESKSSNTLDRKTSRTEKIPKSASRELGHNAESPVTPTGKAGTTDAEEASRLLAEKRRLARVQKEQEEKQRLEEERLKAEELQRKQAEERERQEQAAQQAEKERQRQEDERRKKEEDDKRQKERRLKELQDQLDREREEAFQRVQREAERKQQEREQLKLQEEQERLQRKKRIEEIMKRTRKTDTEPKKDETHTESNSSVIESVSVLESADAGQINGPSIRSSESSTFEKFKSEFPSSITAGSPVINLQPLEAKGSVADDLSDGVQSMDVSPVSRDELMQEYSPISESSENLMRNPQALDLLPLTGQAAYPKAGDCNKNLIQSFSTATADSALIQSLGPSMDKLTV
ncbi:MAP7 domain-containing protein 2 isoform X1 [Pangasianodon hypophthalmus]|uniref:MAP7 domain-containing protein 2 isoform X1 n=1 Tax=Pangasianodon hypophthalmus TaxID=310915 RepID=UPI0023074C16|nr:MAP7 domain-containing protein 2 isoform X1 [Pangasianodon hypophthalmus]